MCNHKYFRAVFLVNVLTLVLLFSQKAIATSSGEMFIVPLKNDGNIVTQSYETKEPADGCFQQKSRVKGIIVSDGPVVKDGYTWWKIDFENDLDGWTADTLFKKEKGSLEDKSFSKGDAIITITDNVNVRPRPNIKSEFCEGTHYGRSSYALDFKDSKDRNGEYTHTFDKSIVASSTGTIYEKKYSESAGNYVILEHANHVFSMYAHLKEFSELINNQEKGFTIEEGEIIGSVGNTGDYVIPKPKDKNDPAGSHLHFAVFEALNNDEDKEQCEKRGHFSYDRCAVLAEPLSGCTNIQEGDILPDDCRALSNDESVGNVLVWMEALKDQFFTVSDDGKIEKSSHDFSVNDEEKAEDVHDVEVIIQRVEDEWKTVNAETFTIRIPGSWREVSRDKNEYRFEGESGEYFRVVMDADDVDDSSADQTWRWTMDYDSGSELEIRKVDEDGAEGSRGDGQFHVWARGDRGVLVKGHLYDFLFGNTQREENADIDTFKKVLESFQGKGLDSPLETQSVYEGAELSIPDDLMRAIELYVAELTSNESSDYTLSFHLERFSGETAYMYVDFSCCLESFHIVMKKTDDTWSAATKPLCCGARIALHCEYPELFSKSELKELQNTNPCK